MELKLGHYDKDGIEVVDVEGEIDIYTAPRLRELLIDLVSKNSYELVVNLEKVGFLDSTGLGVLVGGLRRVRAHDGSLDLVCTREQILRIFRITGLTKVFGIYETVDQAIGSYSACRPRVQAGRRHVAGNSRRKQVLCPGLRWVRQEGGGACRSALLLAVVAPKRVRE